MNRLISVLVCLAVVCMLMASPLQAVTYTWGVPSGNFNVSTNWTNNNGFVPGNTTTDDALIANGGWATINTSHSFRDFTIGTTAGNGAVVQSAGTISLNGSTGTTWPPIGGFSLGVDAGSYGGYAMSGGTLNLAGGSFGYIGYVVGDKGVGNFSQTGGTVNVIGAGAGTNRSYVLVGWEGGATPSVMSLTGGNFIQRSIFSYGLWIGPGANAVLNTGGTANVDLGPGGILMGADSSPTTTSIVNLGGVDAAWGGAGAGGGTLTTAFICSANGPNTLVNFHGETVKLNPITTFPGHFYYGGSSSIFATHAYVYSEGAVIDTNGNTININQSLETPDDGMGQGVSGIVLSGTGSGYIGEPVVTVVADPSDFGTGATARAVMNATGGIDHIVMTNPGVGYTVAPTVVITGGGGTAPAGATVSMATNVSGGLTKTGAGILSLNANSTYTGETNVNEGTLYLNQIVLKTSGITVKSGAKLAGMTVVSPTVEHITPAVTVQSGGTIAPGTLDRLLYINGITFEDGAKLDFKTANGGHCDGLWITGPVAAPTGATTPSIVTVSYTAGTINQATQLLTCDGTIDTNVLFQLPGGLPALDSDDGVNTGITLDTVYGFGGTVTLRPGGVIADPRWNSLSGGNFADAAKWLPNTAPNGGGKRAMFDAALGNGTINVSLNSNTQLSSMIFASPTTTGTGESYNITPSGANAITLDSTMALNWHITSLSGNHTVGAPLKIAAGTGEAAIRVAVGSSLNLTGVISNLTTAASGVNFDGKGNGMSQAPTYGTLKLGGLNTFTGPIAMTGYGRLEISNVGLTTAANALGQSGPAAANLKINGILAYTGTAGTPTTVTTDRGFTLMGTEVDPGSLGTLNGIEVANANVNLKFTGAMVNSGYSAFRKTGAGTVTFANTGTNDLANCDVQVEQGTLVLDSGTFNKARVNIGFQYGGGDIIVGDVLNQTGAMVLQNGATLNMPTGAYLNAGRRFTETGSPVGTVTLNDTSKIVSASHMYFGWDGIGTLTLNGSSSVTNTEHQVIVGLGGVDTRGKIVITGDGLSETAYPKFDNVGAAGNCYTYVGAGTTGEVSITNGSYANSGLMFVGVSAGGNGKLTLNTTAGSLAPAKLYAGTLEVGGSNYDGTSYSGPSVGLVEMNSGSQVTVDGHFYIGLVGDGTVNVGSATGPLATIGAGGNLVVGYAENGSGELNVAPTGYVNMNGSFLIGYTGDSAAAGATGTVNNSGTIIKNANDYSSVMIGRASDSTVNQNAGSFTDNTITSLGQWGHTGILNLNGGVYSTFSVQAGYLNDPTAKGKIVFDGGTLKANVNSFYYNAELNTCNLINPYEGTMEVLVRAGGAVIDSSTMNASVLVPLLEDPASIGGGLTKKGDGVLNLVAGNTYSGDTVVEAGTLNVPSLNTPSATVYVGEGATLVTASLVADTLNIGSLPGAAAPTAVPEPGTLALLALAGLALAGAYLRRG